MDGQQVEQLTAEQVAVIADEQLAYVSDPDGYVLRQEIAQINSEYEALAAVADDETKVKLATVRDARLAALEPPALPAATILTFEDMPLEETAGSAIAGPGIGGKAKWSQAVEPERDGKPWCTWEDAEAMLVASAQAAMRGQGGLTPAGYKVARDDAKMTLTLELV